MVNDIYGVQDDLFTWYMIGKGEQEEPDPVYLLVSTADPAGNQLATVFQQSQCQSHKGRIEIHRLNADPPQG